MKHTKEHTVRLRLKTDFITYASQCLKVRTKEGTVAPFLLNTAQKFIHAELESQLAETGKIRAIILKGRQQGCSTYVEARFYWRVTHLRGVKAFILTHLEEASRNIYQIARRFHDNCPEILRPHTSHSNARELIFDELDTGYHVGTARSQGVGRSSTLQFFHGSEVAYWPNAQEHVSGILQAVPDAAGTEIILESTSNGASGLFYDLSQSAIRNESEYRFIFIPWFWQEEYRKAPPKIWILSEEERALKVTYKLDDAQIFWRRTKINELGGIFAFRREYPSTPHEAFMADHPHALWSRAMIARNRKGLTDKPLMKRIIIAIDPAVTTNAGSDETGIIVAGLGIDNHAYILADLSGRYTPSEWARKVIEAYYDYDADRVVAEVNQGGEMVEYTLRTQDPRIAYKAVRATRGKQARAEPVAAMDEQGRIHHVGQFALLEDQMCSFDPETGKSPDRVDARTWAITELLLGRIPSEGPKLWGWPKY